MQHLRLDDRLQLTGLRRAATGAALALTSTLMTVLLLEVGLRLFGAPSDDLAARLRSFADAAVEADPELGHRLVPGAQATVGGVTYDVNRLGLRDEELTAREAGQRVLVLGDSVTMGWGVPASETFSSRIEVLLSVDPASPVDVVNAGVLGFGTAQEAAWLAAIGPAIRPDLVLVAYYPNDPEATATGRSPWFEHLRLWQVLAPRFAALSVAAGWRPTATEHHRSLHRANSPEWSRASEALGHIAGWCGDRGVDYALALLPQLTAPPYPLVEVHREVARVARGHGFTVWDLEGVYSGVDPSSLRVAPDDAHPNGVGHARLAAHLAPAIAELLATRAGDSATTRP